MFCYDKPDSYFERNSWSFCPDCANWLDLAKAYWTCAMTRLPPVLPRPPTQIHKYMCCWHRVEWGQGGSDWLTEAEHFSVTELALFRTLASPHPPRADECAVSLLPQKQMLNRSLENSNNTCRNTCEHLLNIQTKPYVQPFNLFSFEFLFPHYPIQSFFLLL